MKGCAKVHKIFESANFLREKVSLCRKKFANYSSQELILLLLLLIRALDIEAADLLGWGLLELALVVHDLRNL